MKKILFICKYNAFRSRVAEEYFKKINRNKDISAISQGFIIGGKSDEVQRKIARKFGINIIGKSKPVNLKELLEADKIIVVADDIPEIMFNYWTKPLKSKLEIWKIPDEQKRNSKNIENIIKNIMKRVEKLVGELR